MNPRTPEILSQLLGMADRITRNLPWDTYQRDCDELPKITAAVAEAKGFKNEPGERALVNTTTDLLVLAIGGRLREGPFGDREIAARYFQLLIVVAPYVKEDLAEALDRMARPST